MLNFKRFIEDFNAVEPLLGEGPGKIKAPKKWIKKHVRKGVKKVKAESGPDGPITLNKGVPNQVQNITRDVSQSI